MPYFGSSLTDHANSIIYDCNMFKIQASGTAYFVSQSVAKKKQVYVVDTWGKCYKNFFVRNLRIFVISQSDGPWQAFLAQTSRYVLKCFLPYSYNMAMVYTVNVGGKARSLNKFITFQILHSRGGFWPCPQTFEQAGNTCQRQTVQLITKIRKIRTKKFYNIDTWAFRKTFPPVSSATRCR